MKKVMIVGATSAIAGATARIFAADGARILLVARNHERLITLAEDLKICGADIVDVFVLDVNEIEKHDELLTYADKALGGLDIVLIAYGTLSDQQACEQSVSKTLQELNTNGISTIALLTLIANRFEEQGYGCIAAISSVAGDRGRQSNYVYGTAKAALSTFLQGLRNRLYKSGVKVLTIKPGFVDTPMTASFDKGFLWSQPETIARGIVRAIEKKSDIVYLPFFWKGIMIIIKSIPERFFKRLSL